MAALGRGRTETVAKFGVLCPQPLSDLVDIHAFDAIRLKTPPRKRTFLSIFQN